MDDYQRRLFVENATVTPFIDCLKDDASATFEAVRLSAKLPRLFIDFIKRLLKG